MTLRSIKCSSYDTILFILKLERGKLADKAIRTTSEDRSARIQHFQLVQGSNQFDGYRVISIIISYPL